MHPSFSKRSAHETSSLGGRVSRAIAQTPSSDDKEVIPPRSIQLTAEQSYIIKEIVLSDAHVAQVPRSPEIKIGEKAPTNIELHAFPELVAAKVPQIKTYKFFVVEHQIAVVNPQNIVADIIK